MQKKNEFIKIILLKMKYNIAKRVFLVKTFYEFKEISLVKRAFRTEYPKEGTPSHSVIKNILFNFEKYGKQMWVKHQQQMPLF